MTILVEYAIVYILSILFFGLAPALADALVKRQRKRFNAWFDAGAEAYAGRTADDPWKDELARAWERESVRLAADGSLDADQLARASRLVGAPLDGCEPRLRSKPLEADPIGSALPVAALACAITTCSVTWLVDTVFPAALATLIAALGLCLAITDTRARLIPNVLVAALCVAGVGLRVACGQQDELAMLSVVAALAIGAACGINALRARRRTDRRAIGGGDVKALAALVLCSGSHGLLWACAAMTVTAIVHASGRRLKYGHWGKLPLGPSMAAALTIGAIASAL